MHSKGNPKRNVCIFAPPIVETGSDCRDWKFIPSTVAMTEEVGEPDESWPPAITNPMPGTLVDAM